MDGPIISNISIYNLRATGVFITWITDTPAQSRIDYGTTTAYGNNVTNTTLKRKHGLQITGLTATTAYNYKITVTDAAGKAVATTNKTLVTRTTTYFPGDLNLDGSVNALDLSIVLGNFNKTGINAANGNADGDPAGNVDEMDQAVVLKNWGP